MNTIPWDAVGYGSGWGLVALFVVMLFRGQIVTRREHEETVADKTDRLAKQEALIANLAEQNRVLLDSAIPTVNSVLGALHRAAGEQT